MRTKWEDISKAIRDVIDFVRGKTFIRCEKAMPSNLVLIPLIYVRYHFPQAWKQAKDIDRFLLRSLLAGAFSGTPDQLIDDLVAKINVINGFDINELFDVIRSKGRSLELTDDRFWQMGYGSDTVHLLFNLWYRDFNYTPAYENNLPQVDHIFPAERIAEGEGAQSSDWPQGFDHIQGRRSEPTGQLHAADPAGERCRRQKRHAANPSGLPAKTEPIWKCT